MIRIKVLWLFSFICTLSFSSSIAAATTNQLNAVKEAAVEEVSRTVTAPVNGKMVIRAGNVDSRVKLTNCPEPLKTQIPGRQTIKTSATVLVTCLADNWQLYVPVKIRILSPVVTAARPLDRGVALSAADLVVQMVDVGFQRGQTYTDKSSLIGSRVKRTVGIGQPIQGTDICMVCRNDEVYINAASGPINITAKGTALSDGALGDRIKVRNSKSRRIVDATITAVGEVKVSF
ncbi:flagella basal body P-ring formation protein FlgA [Veronia nyctiphanis]|uniref:Flagella basal body P-ring formation protein FlgA n=1 Tax=Veronia nyctiphanis TaxID=1278244 RepID=A0A4Q0YPJ2_9GAMM|nr:flagellar basal body P-ring formation chaperone FlgA [Veronia nyctiphanis]RXJ72892.1 flagella basal body P-ring formation protein FlgA [Veronia nyctiphanis]